MRSFVWLYLLLSTGFMITQATISISIIVINALLILLAVLVRIGRRKAWGTSNTPHALLLLCETFDLFEFKSR